MSLLSTLFGTKTYANTNVKLLNSEEFKSQIEGDEVQLVDVRTSKEFNQRHIDGAINIDFYSGKFNVEFNKLDKNKAIYVYCRSGNRSRQTSNKISEMGFTEIYDLQGGILNYK